MTCETLQELLLTHPVSDFHAWADHLECCPSCSLLADRVRATDLALTHQESTMTTATFDAAWAAASPARTPFKRRGLLAIALAAVLGLVALQALQTGGPPAGTPNDPSALSVVDADAERFHAVQPPSAEEAANQPTVLLDRLKRKVSALKELETKVVAGLSDAPRSERTALLKTLAEAYTEMGDFFVDSPYPTNLQPHQRTVYVEQIEQQAWVQYSKSIRTWELYLEDAPNSADVQAKVAELETREPAGTPTSGLETLAGALTTFENDREALTIHCTPPKKWTKKADLLLQQGAAAVADADAESAEALHVRLETLRDDLAAKCRPIPR
jgi:hypothetical protein